MTVGQLARAGAFLRAARLIHRGHDDAFVFQSLDQEWVNQPMAVILEVIRLAHQGVAAARKLRSGQDVKEAELPMITELP